MRPLDLTATPQFILSFDFDGTIHNPAATPAIGPGFFDLIRRLRDERGSLWGINTGRSMAHIIEGLVESRFPFLPDWVVAREREIWFPNNFGRWISKDDWNKTCRKDHKRFFNKARKLLKSIRLEIEEHTGATWIEQKDDPAALVARTEEEMDWIVARLRTLTAPEPLLHWQRNSIWLRFGHRDYHKSSSLREVARHYGLDQSRCFAIGDSHNDLDMLAPAAAAMIACPANAVPEIQAHIITHRGYVCDAPYSDGCTEALQQQLPGLAVLDPELTTGLPPALTAATGMDAFTHCLESLTAPIFHPMCDAIAEKGIELVVRYLDQAIHHLFNLAGIKRVFVRNVILLAVDLQYSIKDPVVINRINT